MADIHSYLAGLKRELAHAVQLGKSTVREIETEIERVEKEIEGLVKPADVGAPKVHTGAVTPSGRQEAYLAALKRELAAKPRDPESLKAEIKRVEAIVSSGEKRADESEGIETTEANAPVERAVKPSRARR